jgi:hypothetical protein
MNRVHASDATGGIGWRPASRIGSYPMWHCFDQRGAVAQHVLYAVAEEVPEGSSGRGNGLCSLSRVRATQWLRALMRLSDLTVPSRTGRNGSEAAPRRQASQLKLSLERS